MMNGVLGEEHSYMQSFLNTTLTHPLGYTSALTFDPVRELLWVGAASVRTMACCSSTVHFDWWIESLLSICLSVY